MGKKYDFDYIIIGSGPAGTVSALMLAKAKKRVALVEKNLFGGNNIASRDIPYQIGLDFAHTFSRFVNYPEVSRQNIHFNFPTIASHQNDISHLLQKTTIQSLTTAGVTLIDGEAYFLNSHTISANSAQYTAANFILASGSKQRTDSIINLSTIKYHTPETIIKARRLPKFALIIGGGSTGCEIAEYLAKLGSKVIILEQKSRLLPREDKEAGETIEEYFKTKLGMVIMTGSKVVAVEQSDNGKKVIFSSNHEEKAIRIDCIVLATGSVPLMDYGLENAGVKYKPTGVIVNKTFQTSAKHIYAVGDCIGGESSTERAEYQALVLCTNIINKTKTTPNYNGFIRKTDTCPEVATVGFNEVELVRLKRKYKKSIVYLGEFPISVIKQQEYGFVKILTDHNRRIIGATIVSPNASLMAEELGIAIRHKLPILDIASTPHITNSYNQMIKVAARKLVK